VILNSSVGKPRRDRGIDFIAIVAGKTINY